MVIYNKPIRDKIPEIIKESGKNCNVKKLDDSEFLVQLEKKLVEELAEYQESKNVEELADVLEVVYRISNLKGFDLDKARLEKIEKRGKFEKNLFLIDTRD
ncbi:MAG: nucleoside triphosphate pyrophosphohydrolase [Thaumarchaeota archaeon]|nr:nucleoside triphosphate pyrophosphohydrolase [Candidatus Nitrosopelagicus sp.]MBT6646381.1 nucleoside triphosphate pyrophosphohydrolase [Nitrososphaerota archaeon]